MIKRVLFGVIAITILAVAAGVAVVAGAFALYASLKGSVGQPWAAAITAAVAAAIVALAGLVMAMRSRGSGGGRRKPEPETGLGERLMQIARERPVLAAAGALAAGVIALRNPQLAAGLASAFMAGKAADKAEHKRRR